MNMNDLVLPRKRTEKEEKEKQMISDLQEYIFKELKLNYKVFDIPVDEHEELHTIFVPTVSQNLEYVQNFFIGHGFGGSSLMFFSVIGPLLSKGNLIFWELRGMGLNVKAQKFQQQNLQLIEQYFLEGIKRVLKHYNPTNATFICHSFSAYLILLFSVRNDEMTKLHIKQLLMLSPVGLTSKEEDYKKEINSCGDFLHTIIHRLGWAFKLTYKSPLRTICSCCKRKLIMNSLAEQNLGERQKEMIFNIMDVIIALPDGSQPLFYNFFLPRVLPKVALEPLFVKKPHVPIVLVFGGQLDWVDRIGAQKISKRFPDMISLVQIPGITHNIALHTIQCKQLFVQLFK